MTTSLDFIVITVFSLFILGIGLLFSRTGKTMKSFFAGGESVPWVIGGLSLFMSFFSAGTFVAWGSIAYQLGWVSITIQWTMAFGALVVAFLIAPRWKRTGNLTAAEFIRERLGNRVQKLYVYVFMGVTLFTSAAVLYPVGKLVSTSLGLPLVETTIVLGMIIIAYTAVGGLWAVMVTDILQFVVLTGAVLIILPLTLEQVGGLKGFVDSAPDDFFNLLNGEFTLWFVIAFMLYHIFYIGGNWTFVQRFTSVESPKAASKVAYLFVALYLISPVIWMLPPMIYKTINPSLQGLDVENAYLMVSQLVLPPGLLGLMLTGMYFATSATANTNLNVIAAVFTNDIYKNRINKTANEKQMMRMAKISSWGLGIVMIMLALIIPLMGGMVEVVLSIAAITAGPLLAPPIWALISKKLSGKVTLQITVLTLTINLFFKMILPLINGFKLNRAEEMVLGVGAPFLLLILSEIFLSESEDYRKYQITQKQRDQDKADALADIEEVLFIKNQNKFGLRVIAFSLVITALILFALAIYAENGRNLTAGIGTGIMLTALIPWLAARKITKSMTVLKS